MITSGQILSCSCSNEFSVERKKFSIKTRRIFQKIGKWFQELCQKFHRKSPPRLQALRNRENAGNCSGAAGAAIRAYALQLAADKTTTFSQNIENFIQCTKEGKEASPHVVMRNMRQFMSGMKELEASVIMITSGQILSCSCSNEFSVERKKFSIKTRRIFQKIGKWFQELCQKFHRKSPPRLQALRNRENAGNCSGAAGAAIRAYALQLAADKTTTFSQNIENFIQCTKEGKEASPHVVMRNMRQFMSGMKNYLVKHGEREFEKEVEKERLKLKANEFLNLDAILESVMMSLVVRPLREHVYRLFVEHYAANGSIQTLADSIKLAQPKHIQDLGVRPKIIPPTEASLDRILKYIERLQKADSPLEKLENLLAAISAIFNSVKHANSGRPVTLGADDLLPLLVWVLVRGKVVDAEIEAEYMWGLLHPSLLTGEGGYYLTTLSSAVHVLKTFKSSQGTMSSVNQGCGTPDCSSVLRVLVPDEPVTSVGSSHTKYDAPTRRITASSSWSKEKKLFSETTNVLRSCHTVCSRSNESTQKSLGPRPLAPRTATAVRRATISAPPDRLFFRGAPRRSCL